jgi:hypothetical protein
LKLNEEDEEIFAYPCSMCPNLALNEAGEVGQKAVEVYGLLAANPVMEIQMSWELIFEMVNVRRPSLKRRIYELVCTRLRLEQEHKQADEKVEERRWVNPNI